MAGRFRLPLLRPLRDATALPYPDIPALRHAAPQRSAVFRHRCRSQQQAVAHANGDGTASLFGQFAGGKSDFFIANFRRKFVFR